MELHSSGERFRVYDNVLSDQDFTNICEASRASTGTPVVNSINPYLDGFAYRSDGPTLELVKDDSTLGPVESGILESMSNWHSDVTPQPSLTTSFYHYPQGSALGWHDDGRALCAFILYLSEGWKATFGGELDIVDRPALDVPNVLGDLDSDLVNSPFSPVSTFPRPNRMVVLQSGTLHRIRRVDIAAGQNVRTSWTGFVQIAPAAIPDAGSSSP